jgi:hypothetical protein
VLNWDKYYHASKLGKEARVQQQIGAVLAIRIIGQHNPHTVSWTSWKPSKKYAQCIYWDCHYSFMLSAWEPDFGAYVACKASRGSWFPSGFGTHIQPPSEWGVLPMWNPWCSFVAWQCSCSMDDLASNVKWPTNELWWGCFACIGTSWSKLYLDALHFHSTLCMMHRSIE